MAKFKQYTENGYNIKEKFTFEYEGITLRCVLREEIMRDFNGNQLGDSWWPERILAPNGGSIPVRFNERKPSKDYIIATTISALEKFRKLGADVLAELTTPKN